MHDNRFENGKKNESLPVDLNGCDIAVVLEDERLQSVGLNTEKRRKLFNTSTFPTERASAGMKKIWFVQAE